jgi:hypothetical protein
MDTLSFIAAEFLLCFVLIVVVHDYGSWGYPNWTPPSYHVAFFKFVDRIIGGVK